MKLHIDESRDIADLTDPLDSMFQNYVRTEEYISLDSKERNKAVDSYLEIKQILMAFKKKASQVLQQGKESITDVTKCVAILLQLATLYCL